MNAWRRLGLAACSAIGLAAVGAAQNATPVTRISDLVGGIGGLLSNNDSFGSAVEVLGDLDGNGVRDIAVGVPGDDSWMTNGGAVYILFLNLDGTVLSSNKITGNSPFVSLDGTANVAFGTAVASLGDLDEVGPAAAAIAVGAPNDGLSETGRVHILFLNSAGVPIGSEEIFESTMTLGSEYGSSVANLGDIDGDGYLELAVGDPTDEPGFNKGVLEITTITVDGTPMCPPLRILMGVSGDRFGHSAAAVGDLDADGIVDIAVGAPGTDSILADDDGAIWILEMDSIDTEPYLAVKSELQVPNPSSLGTANEFGFAMSRGAETIELLVGSPMFQPAPALDNGGFWLTSVTSEGLCYDEAVFDSPGGPIGLNGGGLGHALSSVVDFDGDGDPEFFVGEPESSDGGFRRGAVWLFDLGPFRPGCASARNGSGTNPMIFQSLSDPVVGANWSSSVDLTNYPGGVARLSIFLGGPLSGASLPGYQGELLCAPPQSGVNSGTGLFAVPIDNAPSLVGTRFCTQAAVILSIVPFNVVLLNAIDLKIGSPVGP